MNTNLFLSAAPRRATRAAVMTLAVALAVLGPARVEAQTETDHAAPVPVAKVKAKDTAELVVDNGNWLDARVYLIRDDMLMSLGFVGALAKDRLVLPSLATRTGSAVQILVLPIGSTGAYVTPDLIVNPGDEVELMVQNQLALSTVAILPRKPTSPAS